MRKIIGFVLCLCLAFFTSVKTVQAGPVEEIAKVASDFGRPLDADGFDILVGMTNPGVLPDPWKNVSIEFDANNPLLSLAKQYRINSYSQVILFDGAHIAEGVLVSVDRTGVLDKERMRLKDELVEDGYYIVIQRTVLISAEGEIIFSPGELIEVVLAAAGTPVIRSCSTSCPGNTLSSACCFSKDGGVRCTCKSTTQISNEGCDLGGGQGSTGCSVTMEIPVESPPGGSDPPAFEEPVSVDGEPVKNR